MKIKQLLITAIVILFIFPVNTLAASTTEDFFPYYTLPVYDGSWQFTPIRNTSTVTTNDNYAYVAAVNGTTTVSNHLAWEIEFLDNAELSGYVTLSTGENVSFTARAYTELFIKNNVEFGLNGMTAIDGFTHIGIGYGNPSIHGDICANNTDKTMGFSIVFGNADTWESYMGGDMMPNNVRGVIHPINTGVSVTAIYINHLNGGSYRIKIAEYGADELSKGVYYAVYGQERTEYPQLLDVLGGVYAAIIGLLGMVLFLMGFVLWIINPVHLLLIVVSAESIIVLLSLTTSRDIFRAISKFADYNSKAFYALQGMASAMISVFSMAASFVYNMLHALWPLG